MRIVFLGQTPPSLIGDWLFLLLLVMFSSLVGIPLAEDLACDGGRSAVLSLALLIALLLGQSAVPSLALR